ncbi:MAG: HAMP domain-containing histidine kinase [Acidobacteria bacterium]|nr:HAMP domain-containing histidine kinase [Acidobacteriota bacterium]
MVKVRLRTKFLLSMVLISGGLTSLSLLFVRQTLRLRVTQEIFSQLRNSVTTFQSFQREREIIVSHVADLLADEPSVRALMTTQDEATIQDASARSWRLAGSDLFALADRSGRVVALHTKTPGLTRESAQSSFSSTLERHQQWWFDSQHLYQVFLKPIYFGPDADERLFGFLVLGYQIDDRVASQISRIANSKVVFYYGNTVVTSTLGPAMEAELAAKKLDSGNFSQFESVQLGAERFLETTLNLATEGGPNVRLTVLKSYDEATAFLEKLNRLLLGLGLLAVVIGSALVFFISYTFTRPLSSLLAGVAALEKGDFTYRLDVQGEDEVAELARAFDRMRESLFRTQQNLIESERLATIGRMASSISHDLRHSLAAIVANAEFLCESHLSSTQREELYQEIQLAVGRMTELIDSLLEFSRTRSSLRPTYGSLRTPVDNAVQAVRSHPEFHKARVKVLQSGSAEGWFDHRKLERAFFNLVLNACESLPDRCGEVDIDLRDSGGTVEIRIRDNGRGIPAAIRNTLFEPFVSQGKENGTGLGLTVAQRIVQDHRGELVVERSSQEGTVFRVTLPYPTPLSANVTSADTVEPSSAAGAHADSTRTA